MIAPRDMLRSWPALVAIGAVAAGLVGAFAWAKGWIGASGPTSGDLIAAIATRNPDPFPPGFRRAHAKGVCFTGRFRGSGLAAPLSGAHILGRVTTPVVGRFSIGAGDPHAADSASRTLAMALRMQGSDGHEWRLAMNNVPFFNVREPEGFQAQITAARADPRTGKPDPARQAAFLKAYPEAAKFMAWAKAAPWAKSWAMGEYNGVHAFRLIAPSGHGQFVRWRMRPRTAFEAWPEAERKTAYRDHLRQDLTERLARGPLVWDMVLTLAAPNDPIADPSQPWPQGRTEVVAGTLEVLAASDQAQGACRDVNFDPTILPPGIEPSRDPVLAARSAVYARSFRLRESENGRQHGDSQ